VPRRKRSAGKATWPGRKQVWRRYDEQGCMAGDVVSLEDDAQDGEPLLVPVMRAGRRLPAPSLTEARAHAAASLKRLPEPLRQLHEPCEYPVEIALALQELARQVDLNEARE
jgi:nicotinate phosphoribosyltransferase